MKYKQRFFIFLFIAALVFIFFALLRKEKAVIPPDIAEVSIHGTTISIEIADTPERRAQGLGDRDSMLPNHGMLFLFETPGYHAFWMRNMRFPIDIIWIGQDFKIVDIKGNVSPDSYPNQYTPAKLTAYVLEVAAGFVENHSIQIGDTIEPRSVF